MWLALQDIVLESEISKSIQILSKIGNYKKAKRTLILVTDTDWDIKVPIILSTLIYDTFRDSKITKDSQQTKKI